MQLREFINMKTFSGLDRIENGFRVVFDGKTYEVTEDDCDGYRSYLNEVVESSEKVDNTFEEIEVECVYKSDSYYDIVEVYDKQNGKQILVFGTQNCDDYYPYCVLDWMPEDLSINNN